MKRILIFLLLYLSIGFIACDGEDDFIFPEPISSPHPIVHVYDTIKPKEYFPAFPGSYWVYNNGDTLRVEENYKLCVYFQGGHYVPYPHNDTIVLPKFYPNSIYGAVFIRGYSITNLGGTSSEMPFSEILTETEGGTFYITPSYAGNQNLGETIKKDTTIIVNNVTYNDVIVTYQYNRIFMCSPEICGYRKEYYAKGVGLIKLEERDFPVDTNLRVVLELTDYNIVR